MLISLTRSENRRWKVGVVRCIGKSFSFKAETGTVCEGCGEEIAAVELDAWLIGDYLKSSATTGVVDNGGGV